MTTASDVRKVTLKEKENVEDNGKLWPQYLAVLTGAFLFFSF